MIKIIQITGFVFVLNALALYSSNACFASVSGTITDISGKPVINALITFTNETNPDITFSSYTDNNGRYEIPFSPASVSEDMMTGFHLNQNYPNPFNPSTAIPYIIDKSGYINLSVYTITGQKVRTLFDDYRETGSHTATWDGLDNTGKHAGTGVYIYRLKSFDYVKSKKMLLIDGGNTMAQNGTSVAKLVAVTENYTYRVTIHGSTIVVFEQAGLILEEDSPLDFIVKLLPGGLQLVTVPGGTFQMGDEVGDLWSGCRPVHSVTVDGFEMSTTEITNAQYAEYLNEALALGTIDIYMDEIYGLEGDYEDRLYMNMDYSYDENNECWIECNYNTFSSATGKENLPVIAVTWYGAKAFALHYGLDLPTEAEWEYAARGGKQNLYGTDDGTINESNANYDGNIYYPVDVGSYPSNPFGLFDLSGNVFEWCNDWYQDYLDWIAVNPLGAETGTMRVTRGGSWGHRDMQCRTANRGHDNSTKLYHGLGIRVVCRRYFGN